MPKTLCKCKDGDSCCECSPIGICDNDKCKKCKSRRSAPDSSPVSAAELSVLNITMLQDDSPADSPDEISDILSKSQQNLLNAETSSMDMTSLLSTPAAGVSNGRGELFNEK